MHRFFYSQCTYAEIHLGKHWILKQHVEHTFIYLVRVSESRDWRFFCFLQVNTSSFRRIWKMKQDSIKKNNITAMAWRWRQLKTSSSRGIQITLTLHVQRQCSRVPEQGVTFLSGIDVCRRELSGKMDLCTSPVGKCIDLYVTIRRYDVRTPATDVQLSMWTILYSLHDDADEHRQQQ